ncbi:GTP 3',8-cyclase MoaA [Marinobacterium sediminicola]|uniref:GTP 3',8-cyclase n=1 Tax=Marinobacterium sediminicola TaxID=518898 RepID=A0ABY1RZS7_9GAMM|nr:GTP 3',8-cyclase MoaA [Marinobacterium sediminicola]ULG69001.1 GTP 3',8-cyclase MoaA [Marinobacterium sediminicola]SMR73782.1 cyclic pyranopterin monophosphate synthase subunit MoaA [Marinobacterium sediminicola]
MSQNDTALIDRFGRQIHYLRLSVTDRCDFRCVYCMSEQMQFLPREQVLSLEEMLALAQAFTELGVRKIRLTGGEPLVRRNVLWLIERLGELPVELVLTTNGSQLQRFAQPLRQAGVSRLNISLDSLDPERFRNLTRNGRLDQVLAGIDAACDAGFTRIKLNTVVLHGRNEDEVPALVEYVRSRGLDISFIEEMPLGRISEHDRSEAFCSSDSLQARLAEHYTLIPTAERTGGPSRYFRMPDSDSRIGFISPHSHNFCGDCNRVRVTAEGRLLLCLGNEHSVDLRALLRQPGCDAEQLRQAIVDAMQIKPERHHFTLDEEPQILRFMNMTGG